MIVKAKVNFVTYTGEYKKKIFTEGKEYYAYKSNEISNCYIVVDNFNVLNAVAEHRLKTDFEIIED